MCKTFWAIQLGLVEMAFEVGFFVPLLLIDAYRKY